MQKNSINSGTYKMLSGILANTYSLYTKIWNFHVNFVGSDFVEKHELLGGWKDLLGCEIDTIAEQIRKCGGVSPFSLNEFQSMSVIKDSVGKIVSTQEVTMELYNDFCTLDMGINKAISLLNEDLITQNMLIEIRTAHDKVKWFIRSIQGQV